MNNMNHPMMTFMTPDDLEEGTGFKAASKQCDRLKHKGCTFIENGNGKPRLTWWEFNNPPRKNESELVRLKEHEPDFSAMG